MAMMMKPRLDRFLALLFALMLAVFVVCHASADVEGSNTDET